MLVFIFKPPHASIACSRLWISADCPRSLVWWRSRRVWPGVELHPKTVCLMQIAKRRQISRICFVTTIPHPELELEVGVGLNFKYHALITWMFFPLLFFFHWQCVKIGATLQLDFLQKCSSRSTCEEAPCLRFLTGNTTLSGELAWFAQKISFSGSKQCWLWGLCWVNNSTSNKQHLHV